MASRRVARARHVARQLRASVTNRLGADAFAAECAARGPVPTGAVCLWFASGPENTYQLTHWLGPLERLAESVPVAIVVARPDTGRAVLAATSLPVAFAPSSRALETLVHEADVPVVLYVNHVELNFRMLRFASPVHVYLGHGESDKDSSVSNQNRAYDRVFVAGRAAQDRIASHLRGFDVDRLTRTIGSPQLDDDHAGAPDWAPDGSIRVLYAPTWEGDRPRMAYGSVPTHGVALVRALVADPRFRVVYRPHPRAGYNDPATREADAAVRAVLAEHGDRHLVDIGAYGWQWDFCDVCVTDVSSVAYDWLATGKPLLVTRPADARAFLPDSPLLRTTPTLDAADAPQAADVVGALAADDRGDARARRLEAAAYYFGDTADGASTRRFGEAVREAVAYAREHPVPVVPDH
ncbi:CDP-glycerol glycerophosphotransferase family protein [Solicola sp. PLA-1-18]|uniref:CDP-glycerol glycerophosphotransferase family protein n=1 Tax=Solicola sp. PLA-1-18 TaxID=3380532 RepID=UPI003B7D7951